MNSPSSPKLPSPYNIIVDLEVLWTHPINVQYVRSNDKGVPTTNMGPTHQKNKFHLIPTYSILTPKIRGLSKE
jgi:hypothetical protein